MKEKQDKLVETYKKQEKDLRLLTYKILVETFNKKYTSLNNEQKSLLREYINNVTNTSKFNEYFESELIKTITTLHEMYKGMKDKITKIKLRETINVLKKQKIGKKITDEQVSALMMSYELIKEIAKMSMEKTLKEILDEILDEIEQELDEATTTAGVDGYQTPFLLEFR